MHDRIFCVRARARVRARAMVRARVRHETVCVVSRLACLRLCEVQE